MGNSIPLNEVQKYLSFCDKYWTVLYGSFVDDNYIPGRSDIDVAIISQIEDKQTNMNLLESILSHNIPPYDIKIFELLPLHLKMSIINNYMVAFGDPLEISEYFYKFRKIWKDMEKRIKENQFSGIEEKLRLIREREKFFEDLT